MGQGFWVRSQCFQGRASLRGQGHPAGGEGSIGLGARVAIRSQTVANSPVTLPGHFPEKGGCGPGQVLCFI